MEIKGKVVELGETIQVTDSLKKRELIVEYAENPQYPEYLKFEAIQDRCDLMDELTPGDEVEVHFNLKGRPWTDKTGKKVYFNSMQIWKIKSVSQAYPAYVPATGGGSVVEDKGVSPQYAAPADISSTPDDDDLPF
jgi:single-stranded DNA-binding protein